MLFVECFLRNTIQAELQASIQIYIFEAERENKPFRRKGFKENKNYRTRSKI